MFMLTFLLRGDIMATYYPKRDPKDDNVREYTQLLFDCDVPATVYNKVEDCMKDLLSRFETDRLDLCAQEYLFLIVCFYYKLYIWCKMCGERSSSDCIDFDTTFFERVLSVKESAVKNYWRMEQEGRIVSRLSKNLFTILDIYKEAKTWMTKRGYNI